MPTLFVTLLSLGLVADLFLGDLDIGPFSSRVYLMFLLLAYVLAKTVLIRQSLFKSKEAYFLFIVYALFIFWAMVNSIHNLEPLPKLFYGIASTHGMALTIFLVAQAELRTRKDLGFLGGMILVSAVVSGLVAICQWQNMDWAYDLVNRLRPIREEKIGEILLYAGYAPGLSSYSIPFSYHMVTFGFLAISRVFLPGENKGSLLSRSLQYLAVIVIPVAILISLSRSAALAGVIGFLFVGRYVFSGRARGKKFRLGFAKASVLVVLLFGLIFSLYSRFSESSASQAIQSGPYSLGRIIQMEDPVRAGFTAQALNFASKHLLLGGGLPAYLAESPDRTKIFGAQAPHNIFLNCLVYYGLPGICLLFVLLWRVYITCNRALGLMDLDPGSRWLVVGAVAGVLAYFLNSLFHNDSFVTGGTLPWWLLGLLCAYISQMQQQERKVGLLYGR